jgi:type IV pilus assembly protein PilY1
MKTKWLIAGLISFILAWPAGGFADDTEIYGSANVVIEPNVLIIFDNSGSMNSNIAVTPDPYVPATDYSSYGAYARNTVYRSSSGSWSSYVTAVSSLSTWCATAYNALTTAGSYTGHVQNSNGCGTTTRTTALGNYLNYLAGPGATSAPKLGIAKDVVTTLLQNTDGVRFGLMVFNSNQGGHMVKDVKDMATGTNKADLIAAVNAITATTSTPLAETLYEAGLYYQGTTSYFNQLSTSYNSATDYTSYGSYTKNTVYRSLSGSWNSFIADVNTVSCSAAKTALTTTGLYTNKRFAVDGSCPGSGTRYDFALGNYLNYLYSLSVVYTTPIEYSCQKNYIVIMTDGDPTNDDDPILASAVGDTDGDGEDPGGANVISYSGSGTDWLDDVAKKWYDGDLLPSSHVAGAGKQNIITYTIGFSTGSTAANLLLGKTAANGRGEFYAADDAQALTSAFLSALGEIVEDNTSFVAPVVPVSPQNRTYSGDYVYIGFFRPNVESFWSGNIKKYAIRNGQIMGNDAPWSSSTHCNPLTGVHCAAATNADGSFIESGVYSYWSTVADGGAVQQGGVGAALLTKTLNPSNFDPAAAADRKIYTYFGTNAQLKHASNQFEIGNASITTGVLTVTTSTEKDDLIKFIHGQDAYDGLTAARDWILGDVLHSGPTIVSYDNGVVSGTPRSVIYVGANDGMLHAFDDSDGRELWGYIPKDQLAYLKNLHGTLHPYSVDGSPKAYILDNNSNGVIESGNGDKVYLIFGERRGGSTYHAIDVTNPDDPQFFWSLSPSQICTASPLTCTSTTTYGELGQSWSTPLIQKVNLSAGVKTVFFVGGGYDANNEDVSPATTDALGRAVYAVDITNGSKVWGYTVSNNASMTSAIPSNVTLLDDNRDTYADRLYVGDVGGRMWRFDLSDPLTSNWSGRILFSSNPGADASTHRKILYSPDVTREAGYYYLYFGTGDREHPLDTTTTVDRIYAVKDVDGSTASLTESSLVDVTTDVLQSTGVTQTTIDSTLASLAANSGWYIKLNFPGHTGEKVVSSAVIYNKVVNISTFQPTSTNVTVDPCLADVGVGRVYAVNYKTGEAVFNYDAGNDTVSTTNIRAKATGTDYVLMRDATTGQLSDDRVQTVGAGIPSEPVIVIPENGTGTCDVMALIGIGGGVAGVGVSCGGGTYPLFWREIL